ncbi:hypothetical protein CR513_55823, partial [Mucuna pruriens]
MLLNLEGSRRDSPRLYGFGSSTSSRGIYSNFGYLQEVKIDKWKRSNRMCLMIMKHSILEAFRGFISKSQSENRFLEEIEQFFAKNEKTETSNLLAKLISMKYKGRGNIREYIMEVSDLIAKFKSLKLELDKDLIVHLLKLNFNMERKLKLSNLIVVVNTMYMMDHENNIQGLLSFFSKSVECSVIHHVRQT